MKNPKSNPGRKRVDPSDGLYDLTKFLTKKLYDGVRQNGGLLGGEYGYGVEYENDVFMMHPFCWCEADDCGWCAGIGAMPQLLRDVMNVKYNESGRLPNFLYKPTGAKIWWYKYIGRGMESEGELPENWLEECKKSLPTPSKKVKPAK